jgi:hypothetical protein
LKRGFERRKLSFIPVATGLLCGVHLWGAEPGSLRLDGLWKDMPITDLTTRWGESLGDKAKSRSPWHHMSK